MGPLLGCSLWSPITLDPLANFHTVASACHYRAKTMCGWFSDLDPGWSFSHMRNLDVTELGRHYGVIIVCFLTPVTSFNHLMSHLWDHSSITIQWRLKTGKRIILSFSNCISSGNHNVLHISELQRCKWLASKSRELSRKITVWIFFWCGRRTCSNIDRCAHIICNRSAQTIVENSTFGVQGVHNGSMNFVLELKRMNMWTQRWLKNNLVFKLLWPSL
jgi:hypothetical protein